MEKILSTIRERISDNANTLFAVRESSLTRDNEEHKYICKDSVVDNLLNEIIDLAEDEHEYNKFKYDYNKVSLKFNEKPSDENVLFSATLTILGNFRIHSFDLVQISNTELTDVVSFSDYIQQKMMNETEELNVI